MGFAANARSGAQLNHVMWRELSLHSLLQMLIQAKLNPQ